MIFHYHLRIGEVRTTRNETTYPIHGKYPLNQNNVWLVNYNVAGWLQLLAGWPQSVSIVTQQRVNCRAMVSQLTHNSVTVATNVSMRFERCSSALSSHPLRSVLKIRSSRIVPSAHLFSPWQSPSKLGSAHLAYRKGSARLILQKTTETTTALCRLFYQPNL